MPIAFPLAARGNAFSEGVWLRQATKTFNAVSAPNLGRVGFPLQAWQQGGSSGWSMNPGIGIAPNKAVNLRRLGTMYADPCQTAVVNPAALFDEMYDMDVSFDRDLGQQNTRIVGVSRDATGVALGSCVIKVYRTVDDVVVGSTTSDGSGNWTVYPNQQGPYYFVEYKAGSPDVFGTSPNTNTATQFTPGA